MASRIQIFAGGTAYGFNAPQWEYETDIYTGLHFDRISGPGYVFWSDGVSYVRRSCRCRFLGTKTDAASLSSICRGADKGRGAQVTLKLPPRSGFYPWGPDKGDQGSCHARIIRFEPAAAAESPLDWVGIDIEMCAVTYWPYAAPAQVPEGPLTIGTVTRLRYPTAFPTPSNEYAISTAVTRNGTPCSVDRLSASDHFEATMQMLCNQSKACALISHLVNTVRENDVTIQCNSKGRLFGIENADDNIFTCKWIQNKLTVKHVGVGQFGFELKFYMAVGSSSSSSSSS